MTDAKVIARQIKKELNAAFNNGKPKEQKIKFSVTSQYGGYGHQEINIKWVGGPCVNDVEAIGSKYDTFIDHSDTMVDYFRAEGIEVVYSRSFTEAEAQYLVQYCSAVGNSNGYIFSVSKCWDSEGYCVEIKHEYMGCVTGDHDVINQFETFGGIFEELPEPQEEAPEGNTEKTPELIEGDYQGGDVKITIHWHEGVQVVTPDAQFGSFTSAQKALEEIATAHPNYFSDDSVGYLKVKVSITWKKDGYTWQGRLDLKKDENPLNLGDYNNLIEKHITEFFNNWDIEAHPLTDKPAEDHITAAAEMVAETFTLAEIVYLASRLYKTDLRAFFPGQYAPITDKDWLEAQTSLILEGLAEIAEEDASPAQRIEIADSYLVAARLGHMVDAIKSLAF